MRRAVLILVLLGVGIGGPAAARAATLSVSPAVDLGLAYACDWSYDWESRCYRDDGPRLPIGVTPDAVWRAALRFPLAAVPADASIVKAELLAHHDGTCLAPRLATVPCPHGYVLDAHRVLGPSWSGEREPALDPRIADTAVVLDGPTAQWLRWDLTALARAWHGGLVSNGGALLKLQDGDEEPGAGGLYGPSAGHPDPELRPRLVVAYTGAR